MVLPYGGCPSGGAWNPVTWTLAGEMHEAAAAILETPRFAYLGNLFGDRAHPFRTRMYYAITAHENERLLAVCGRYGDSVRALLHDGFLVERSATSPTDVEFLDGAICKPMVTWADNV